MYLLKRFFNFKTRESKDLSIFHKSSFRAGLFLFLLSLILAVAAVVFTTDSEETDKKEAPRNFLSEDFLKSYLKITDSLASDSVKDVSDAAKQMAVQLDGYLENRSGKNAADQLLNSAELISLHARLLQDENPDIEKARGIFSVISDQVSRVFSSDYDGPDKDKYHIFYCPMAGHYWIQKSPEIRNPFFGSKMIGCGSEVEAVEPEAAVTKSGEQEEDDPFAVIDAPPSQRAESIMKKLKCACCGKPLLPATCGCAVNTGMQVKNAISEMEDEGLKDEEIITRLRTKFGNKVVPEKLSGEGTK